MADRASAIGIDIGGTRTKVAVVLPDGSTRDQVIMPTRAGGDEVGGFLDSLAALVGDLRDPSTRGLGIAVPGLLDDERRSVLFNPNTPGIAGIDIKGWAEALGLPASVEQDVIAPAVSEARFGAGRGSDRFLAAVIGTGLGAGIIADGEALRFVGSAAGDNGHVILDPNGPSCSAGCHGCAEAFVASAAIERAATRVRDPRWAGATQTRDRLAPAVIADAREGYPPAARIMGEIGRLLGQWLASLAPIFMPDRIALCGGVAEAGQPLLSACGEAFRALAAPAYARCDVVLGSIGSFAGVIGAANPFLGET